MMLTKEEIIKVSEIAKIHITDEEAQMYTKGLNDVLKFVDTMNEFDLQQNESNIS